MPINPDYGKGYLQTARYFVLSPEQTRYTTQLAQQPDDPLKVQEIYVFLPSLRRSLRLSSAARCSPILGTDWVQDDNSDGMAFQIPNFNVRFVGQKKLLFIVHANDPGMYDNQNYLLKSSVPAFPAQGGQVGTAQRDGGRYQPAAVNGRILLRTQGRLYRSTTPGPRLAWDFYDVNPEVLEI